MNYEQFIDAMLACTKSKLPGTDIVEVQNVQKNNGVKLIGLVIRKSNRQIAPVIYLEEFYKRYLTGWSIEQLSSMLIERSTNIPGIPSWDFEEFKDFSKIQDKIVYKLINAKANEELLKGVPHLPILDFAIVFSLLLSFSEKESGSVLIKNGHIDYWKCPISSLYECAKRNTPRLCPSALFLLNELMEEIGEEIYKTSNVYVLTNQSGTNGAAALLYPGIPRELYEMIGGNYYLLPSSVHEFLIVPEVQEMVAEELRVIVREVNATQLEREEFLSDDIYYFDGNIITKI